MREVEGLRGEESVTGGSRIFVRMEHAGVGRWMDGRGR